MNYLIQNEAELEICNNFTKLADCPIIDLPTKVAVPEK